MSKVIILGPSNAIPTKDNENTHMVVGEERMVLFDCVATPSLRLEQAGLDSRGELWFVGALKIEKQTSRFSKSGSLFFSLHSWARSPIQE
jgi:hypothetical protein